MFRALLHAPTTSIPLASWVFLNCCPNFGAATAANDKQAWTDAGTADGNSTKNMVSFTITGTSIESSIIFDGSNGADTKGTTWSAY